MKIRVFRQVQEFLALFLNQAKGHVKNDVDAFGGTKGGRDVQGRECKNREVFTSSIEY
jgi:hypothetical protein